MPIREVSAISTTNRDLTLGDGLGVAVVVFVLRIAAGVEQALDHGAIGVKD